jgi:RimJ/RimL family protein N-acetyltransferase
MPDYALKPIEVRLALPPDGPALARTIGRIDGETDYLGEPGEKLPWDDREAEHLRDLAEQGSGVYVVACAGDEIVGFLGAFAGWFARSRGVIFIAHVGLRMAYRGRRIGGLLLDAVETWSRTRGAHRLELMVVEENARALALYHRQGFAIEGRMPDSFRANGRSRTGFLMGKLLVSGDAVVSAAKPAEDAGTPAGAPPAGLAVRKLTGADWPALRAYEEAFLRTTALLLKTPSELAPPARFEADITKALASELRLLVVATLGETPKMSAPMQIVGFATVAIEIFSRMAHGGDAFIGVLPGYCRRGIGGLLAARVEAWARERRLSRLAAFAQADNLAARRFAAREGYREEVRMRSYARIDGALLDRLRFGKILAVPDAPAEHGAERQ